MKQKQDIATSSNDRNRGQSLVEVALFLPIFLIILAGVVEVSQLVITQNRITNASRAGTRFASNGGEDIGVVEVVLTSVTQTLSLEPDVWDIWTIHARVSEDGASFREWEFNHVYGITETTRANSVDQIAIQQRILSELQIDHEGNTPGNIANDLRIVGVYVIHDVESILGLDALPWLQGFHSVEELNVMRVFASDAQQTDGCTAFPIAVSDGIRSLTENTFPANFDYPSPSPTIRDFANHQEDIPLSAAQEGYVYQVTRGFDSGEFGWLVWNDGIPPTANTLADSLRWPGNSADYSDHGDPGTTLPGFNHVVRGYAEPGDPSDLAMQVNDFVAASTSQLPDAGMVERVQENIDRERDLRLITWNTSAPGAGPNGQYQIARFAVFKLRGYGNAAADDEWLLLEFIRWDDSCGQNPLSP